VGELRRRKVLVSLHVREQRARLAHAERVIDLRSRVPVVEWRRDQPCLEAREVVDDELAAVRHEGRDPVAGLEPEPEVARGESAARVLEHLPGQAGFGRHERKAPRIGIEADPEQVARRGRTLHRRARVCRHEITPSRRSRASRA